MRKATFGALALPVLATGGLVAGAQPAGAQTPTLNGDLDGDGRADRATLVASGSVPGSCAVSVELGLAGGGYGPATSYDFTVPGADYDYCPDMGVIVDLGGDGVSELVLAWFAGSPVATAGDLLVLRDFVPVDGFAAMYQPSTISTHDFNADGLVDIYQTTDQGDGFQSYLNTPSGELVPGPVQQAYQFGSWQLTDVDEDGKADLAVSYGGDAGGEYEEATVVVLDDGTRVVLDDGPAGNLTVGDANHDGHVDIAVQDGTDTRIFYGDGLGGFTPK